MSSCRLLRVCRFVCMMCDGGATADIALISARNTQNADYRDASGSEARTPACFSASRHAAAKHTG
jgi:hypothetical protein